MFPSHRKVLQRLYVSLQLTPTHSPSFSTLMIIKVVPNHSLYFSPPVWSSLQPDFNSHCLVQIPLSIILPYLPIQGRLFSSYNGLTFYLHLTQFITFLPWDILFFLDTTMSPFQYFFASFSQSSLRVLSWVSLSPLFLEWQFSQVTPHS